MKKYEEVYEKLREEFSDEEIVERFVFPEDLTAKERAEAEEEFKAIRLELLKGRTEQQRLLAELMRMKLLMQDYLKSGKYDASFSFARQLETYIKTIDRQKKDFAEDINIHPTRLSRILNERENPNVELVYRLEQHCGQIIPAIYWWKLHARKLEEEILTDEATRIAEGEKVKNQLKLRA